jgi:hypothetical protein
MIVESGGERSLMLNPRLSILDLLSRCGNQKRSPFAC